MKTNLRPRCRANSGFSLVEIVVAVGIVATVMVALLGMIPTGLNTVNEAADKMAEIRIAHQVIGEVQMTAWDDLDGWNEELLYDSDGNRLQDRDLLKVRYVCKIEIGREDDYILPGGQNVGDRPVHYAQRVVVKIANKRGGGSVNWSDDAPRKEFSSFTTLNVMTDSVENEKGF